MAEKRRYCPCSSHGSFLLVVSFVLFLSRDASVAAVGDAPSSPSLEKEQLPIMVNLSRIVASSRWNTTLNPCHSWSGVSCSSSGPGSSLVVTRLTLRGLDISSSAIFAYICPLKTLQVLDLSMNSIPSLPHQYLPVPCQMSAALQRLNLSSNKLSGPLLNFSVFPKLEILDLSFNSFSGRLTTELNSLPKLISLNLSSNTLEGDVPNLGNMSLALEELVLSGNQFTGHIPNDLFQCLNLTMLDLRQNNLTGELDSDFRNLHKLQNLLLSGNDLSGQIPSSLSTLMNLSWFAANQNNFIGSLPDRITKHVRMLDLSYNNLNGTIPLNFFSPSRLETVDLTMNQLEGNITGHISPKLYRLRLGGNRISGSVPDSIGDALALAYLELDSNNLAGNITSQLGNCKNLTLLNLANNTLEGSVPGDFRNLEKLEVVKLQMNSLSGSIPVVFSGLTNLGILNLSQNSFTGEVPPSLLNLVNLTNLNLQGNKISGKIPSTISSTSLIELNIANNALIGPIPKMPTSLKTALNLSHNQLDGPIPPSVGLLADLEILDLSYNHLSGQVPSSLTSLQSLTVLVLSYNQLSGLLPNFGPHVSVISNGNTGLTNVTQDNKVAPTSSRRHTTLIIIFALVGTLIGLTVLTAVALYTYSKRIYRVKDEDVPDESIIPQIVNGHLITMNSIHTSAIEFMKAMEAVSNHNNIFLKTRFCTYYKAVMRNGSTYSVKKLNWSYKIFQIGSQEKFGREMELLGKLTNSNVMVPLAYILTVDCAYLIYEHVYKGTVSDFLHGESSDVLDWPSRYSIALGVAQGLTFLQGCTQPVLLLDLSTRTIHLKSANEPQIGDIELYKIIDPSRSTGSFSAIAGTVGYIPPEYAYTMRLTMAGNIYSFGVILLELLTGKPAVNEGIELAKWVLSLSARPDQREQILDTRVSGTSAAVHSQMLSVLNIALSCVAFSPDARPKMRNVLRMLFNAK